jgi:Ala-tRNA(Pro) deacylase
VGIAAGLAPGGFIAAPTAVKVALPRPPARAPDDSDKDGAMSETTETPRQLADGSAPASPQDLLDKLAALDIAQRTVTHPPVFTVEESKSLRGELPGGHTKNLFLRNKKGAMWLVTCLEDRRIDLKKLSELLGAGRFSFGSGERLMRYLGVIPGAVTPFAVINDRTGAVQMVLDRGLFAHDPLNFHPLDNAMTTAISPQDLVSFLEAVDHPPQILDLDALDLPA